MQIVQQKRQKRCIIAVGKFYSTNKAQQADNVTSQAKIPDKC